MRMMILLPEKISERLGNINKTLTCSVTFKEVIDCCLVDASFPAKFIFGRVAICFLVFVLSDSCFFSPMF